MAEPVTIPIFCLTCRGAVTLRFTGWNPQRQGVLQEWTCPWCHIAQAAEFPGAVGYVAKGHGGGPAKDTAQQ